MRLYKTVILSAFCLITKIKSSNRPTMLRFYFCSGVEYNQNSWFCKASYLKEQTRPCRDSEPVAQWRLLPDLETCFRFLPDISQRTCRTIHGYDNRLEF